MTASAAPASLELGIEALTAELPRWHVPGIELAVVREGATLFAAGVGVRSVDDPAPISGATLFQHGSCTKAYTSLVAALVAEQGLLDLDAPVRTYVPELRLPDPVLADRVTTRDLLSNRSGIGRNDVAWICNPSWSREECVSRLEHLALADSWRAGMNYSNFGYALAGLVIGRAAGNTWEAEMRTRLIEPAKMGRTSTSIAGMAADPDHAGAHLVHDGVVVPTHFRVLNGIAPAGELATCADDAARWLLLQLGDGTTGEDAVIPESAVAATHQMHVALPADAGPFPELKFLGYALGWVSGTFRGRPVLWHSGGVIGFLTQTLLLPEQRIGVVACANSHMSGLPLAAVLQIADVLLGTTDETSWYDKMHAGAPEEKASSAESRTDPVPGPSHRLDDFAGNYADQGYGELTVSVEDEQLRVTVGSEPFEARHRHYDTWDLRYPDLDFDVTVSFNTDPAGVVSEAVLPMDAAAAPIRFSRAPSGESE
jgi:CubicO group peptidase (beta-lactamase class C family)